MSKKYPFKLSPAMVEAERRKGKSEVAKKIKEVLDTPKGELVENKDYGLTPDIIIIDDPLAGDPYIPVDEKE
jgi:phage baseplate assembly protein W